MLGVVFHLLAQCAFYFVGVLEHVFYASKLAEQLACRFRAHTRTSRHVVARIAHQPKIVDDLCGVFQTIFFANGLFVQNFERIAAASGLTHHNAWFHQLCIVLIGRNHLHKNSRFHRLFCHGANHVVGLEAGRLEQRNAIGPNDVLDERYGKANVLGCGFALRLVFGIGFVAKGGAGGVEGNADEVGLFFAKNLFERIDKTIDGRGVLFARIDARRIDERIIGAINERIGIEQAEFHSVCTYFGVKVRKSVEYFRFFVLLLLFELWIRS